jgi:RNA polymerase sigma-70 factor, ECF subfamily
MASDRSSTVTKLLQKYEAGDPSAVDRLFANLYKELHDLAEQCFRRESPSNTIQPTALVHEAYVRLIDQKGVDWQGRAHFLGVAAQAMRRILVDHARKRHADKRGGQWHRVTLNERLIPGFQAETGLVALDDALKKLAAVDPRQAQMVELRFFGGLSVAETAEVMGISKRSVEREWTMVRAWLRRELDKSES